MCKEDVRIGRASSSTLKTGTATVTVTSIAPADAARIGLVLVHDNVPNAATPSNLYLGYLDGGTFITLLSVSDTEPYALASIGSHGQGVTGELAVSRRGAGDVAFRVTLTRLNERLEDV